ncbi:Beta-ketoadipate enol-lactone hydrolase [Fimbriiglobus ruber]|uniref:Beta-ketoadipate enol-lactone hydrolase n=1 Tax=Fimbriiglobus ruber TaxID=1908690 RepID=A0A225CZW8_9BACT|nr:Beta-ketoadipate enol-lactone hydrolase [Fimbriiglobus ruber]
MESAGCRIAYKVRGDGPPVIFIQGVGVHGDGWSPQVDTLSSRYRCLTFDNRGLGQSQSAVGALSIEQMASDALAILDALEWKTAHVVGHSMGGAIALQLALAARARVRSLSLLCTFANGRDATRLSLGMIWTGLRTRIGTRRMRRRAFLEIIMPPAALAGVDRDALAERMVPYFGRDLADQPPIVMKQLGALSRFDATPRLGELEGLPTLIVSAAHDRISPPVIGRRFYTAIPGARFVEMADAAHGVPIHDADRINALLLDHFQRADGV